MIFSKEEKKIMFNALMYVHSVKLDALSNNKRIMNDRERSKLIESANKYADLAEKMKFYE